MNSKKVVEKKAVKCVAKKKPRSTEPFVRKYIIEDCLGEMTKRDYDLVKDKIPKLIGKCGNTFTNYKNIPIDSKEEIPYNIGILLESFFELPPGGLYRNRIVGMSYKDVIISDL